MLGPLALGATTIVNEAWIEPEAMVEQIERHRPNVVFTVPSLLRRFLALGPAAHAILRQVPLLYSGGEPVPGPIFDAWRDAVGGSIAQCYGMSETFTNVLAERPGRLRAGSCGELLDGADAKLTEANGAPVASSTADQSGVLWIKHPTIASRYVDPAVTARVYQDGWFCTNDRFRRDADGFFHYEGRADEMLKIAGQWVKPLDLEGAVLGTDLVREAACVVVPDEDGFERLALFVVPGGDDGGARSFAERELAARLPRHSQPKWIRAIDELPRTPTGKVQRFKLRELLRAELKPPRA